MTHIIKGTKLWTPAKEGIKNLLAHGCSRKNLYKRTIVSQWTIDQILKEIDEEAK